MERRRLSSILHIDGLPDEIIGKLLTHLPIKAAVRTSVLAKKWRYTWTQLPELVFDDGFCEDPILNGNSELLIAINQVLLFHDGPLNGFKLSLSDIRSSDEIDQFVLAALVKKVKNLTLEFREVEFWEDDCYSLPSSMFTYGQQLETLNLFCCILKPPLGKGFSKLKDLWLEEAGICGSGFSSLISNCPLLESLYYKTATKCGHLDIASPNLKFLFLECFCYSLCFNNTPKLAVVRMYLHDSVAPKEIEASGKFMLHGKLPVVEELTMDEFYSKNLTANEAPSSLINDLRPLKSLTLWGFSFGVLDKVTSALCLVRNSPNLQTLTVNLGYLRNKVSDLDLTQVEGFSDVTLDHLRKVELTRVSGSKCEMQFIELILAKSPALEKFLIIQHPYLSGHEEWQFKRQLAAFQHASPLVKIACS